MTDPDVPLPDPPDADAEADTVVDTSVDLEVEVQQDHLLEADLAADPVGEASILMDPVAMDDDALIGADPDVVDAEELAAVAEVVDTPTPDVLIDDPDAYDEVPIASPNREPRHAAPRSARRVAREHVCGVRFRRAGKIYWFDASPCPTAATGQQVVVETMRGREIGLVVIAPGQVQDANLGELTPLVRVATEADQASQAALRQREPEALLEARVHVRRQDLPMKAVMAEYNYDGSRLTIYFTSDEMRVDFRNLVRDLARSLHTRVMLRQIGPRDQAKLIGGIDRCGRELCCTSWMPEFQPISIRMAKNQGLPLNPSEISGVCGKLLCCLAFEDDQYRDMRKGLPKVGAKLVSAVGKGRVIDVNVITRKITIIWETGSRVEVDAAAFAEQQDRLMKAFGGGEVPAEFLPPEARPAAPVEHGPRRVYLQRDTEGGDDPGDGDEGDAPAAPASERKPPPARSEPPAPYSSRPPAGPIGPRGPSPSDRRPSPGPDAAGSGRDERGSRPRPRRDGPPSASPPGVGDPARPRRPRRRRGGRGGGGEAEPGPAAG